jgi:hypothetical protein
MGRFATLIWNGHLVVVPGIGPLQEFNVDSIEEEMVKKPDMSNNLNIETTVDLKILEENLPLGSNPRCEVKPEAFNTDVVDTPRRPLAHVYNSEIRLTFPKCKNHGHGLC